MLSGCFSNIERCSVVRVLAHACLDLNASGFPFEADVVNVRQVQAKSRVLDQCDDCLKASASLAEECEPILESYAIKRNDTTIQKHENRRCLGKGFRLDVDEPEKDGRLLASGELKKLEIRLCPADIGMYLVLAVDADEPDPAHNLIRLLFEEPD